MSPLFEGAIIGALTGVILLGLAASWFGILAAFVISAAQFDGDDLFKIAGIIASIGIVGGIALGGSVGLLSRVININIEGAYIGIFAGAVTLCFGGFVSNFIDNSTRQVKFERAVASGTLGLIIGGVLGGILGSIITLIMEAIK